MINKLKKLLDYIYKKKCYFCSSSKDNSIFCSSCYEKIDFMPLKPVETINGSSIYGCCYYKNQIQKLIRGLKYHNKKELAFYQAKIMNEYWQKINNKKEKYTVIPVPLHKNRQKKRKFNHMDLVCYYFCNLTGDDLNIDLIKRIKDTKPQYKLSKKEREINLKEAFKINKYTEIKSPILVIDDITTTGSTLLEIIKELNKNDIFDITALTTAVPENNSFYIY